MDVVSIDQPGLVAQWIRRLPTEQEIPGSSPGGVNLFLFILPGGLLPSVIDGCGLD